MPTNMLLFFIELIIAVGSVLLIRPVFAQAISANATTWEIIYVSALIATFTISIVAITLSCLIGVLHALTLDTL